MAADEQSDYGATWYAGMAPQVAARAPLRHDLDVDVCVIGGGLAGLTAAREVARRGWSVAILEARRVAWNASSRNSGVVLPGFSAAVEKIAERIGVPATRALWELSLSGVQYIRDVITESGDSTIVEGSGWLDVSKRPDMDRILARLRLLQEMGIAAEAWQTEQVRETLRTSHYFAAIHLPDGFQINPLAYAQALASAALQAGARIFENTPVTVADLAGIRKRIDTPHGRVRAGHVVLAGNVHLGSIARPLADTLVPVTAYAGVTKPLGKPLARAVAFRGAVSDSRHGNHHYRVVGRDRLLWTGSAVAGKRWARLSLERAIRATYPQLGPVQFEYFWPAQTGFAVHRMPQIGEVDRGVWLAAGFGGQGLNTSAMAGNLIARAIVEHDDTWHLFLPFELVWAGGRPGRTLARTTECWFRWSEAMLALAARQREEFQRRRQEQKKKGAAKAGTGKAGEKGSQSLGSTLRLGYEVANALGRKLKLSFAPGEQDRPIKAPEALPAAGAEGRSPDEGRRHPGTAAKPRSGAGLKR